MISKSPQRKSKSIRRKSPRRKSKSVRRKSPRRKSKSVRRKSPRRKSKSIRRKSPQRKSKSIRRKSKSKPSSEIIILKKSTNPDKKYMVKIGNKTIHFGSSPYTSYEVHHDPIRKKRYEIRHKSRENWKKSGIKSAGFWSKWILWNKPSLNKSIRDTEKRFKIKIIYKR